MVIMSDKPDKNQKYESFDMETLFRKVAKNQLKGTKKKAKKDRRNKK